MRYGAGSMSRRMSRRARRAAPSLLLCLCVLAAWAPIARTAAPSLTVLCLGDSLTEGYGVEPEQAYPAVLERRLRDRGYERVRVVNAGISGSTSASAVSRLRWQLRSRPDVVVLALGANDGLRGIAVESTRANLDEAIALARAGGARVLLAGMQIPPNYGPDYTRAFRELFPALAAKHGIELVPFLLEGVAAQPDLNLPDGIHPNPRGYRIVADNVLEHLVPLLESPLAEAAEGAERAAGGGPRREPAPALRDDGGDPQRSGR